MHLRTELLVRKSLRAKASQGVKPSLGSGRALIWGLGEEDGAGGSWVVEKGVHGNPELGSGISLIVSIPFPEYLELYSPELFGLYVRISQRCVF